MNNMKETMFKKIKLNDVELDVAIITVVKFSYFDDYTNTARGNYTYIGYVQNRLIKFTSKVEYYEDEVFETLNDDVEVIVDYCTIPELEGDTFTF